jgi:hypothetical protein
MIRWKYHITLRKLKFERRIDARKRVISVGYTLLALAYGWRLFKRYKQEI